MLTEIQIEILSMLSVSVWFGLICGGLAGAIAGALVHPLRTRRFFNFLPGAFCAALPSAAFGIALSLIFSVLEMLFCKLGDKGGWDIPIWGMSIQAVSVFIAGVLGALSQLRDRKPHRKRRLVFWILGGAFIGALANLVGAFDGYLVAESNKLPIEHAVSGFVIGGIIVALWRAGIDVLENTRIATETQAKI